MPRTYWAVAPETDPTAARTVLEGLATAERPLKILRWFVTAATTTSAVIEVHLLRITATGTGTGLTPAPLEQGGQAAQSTWKYDDSAEPTAGTIIERRSVNLLAGIDIVYSEDDALWIPGATNEGVAIEFIDDPNEICTVGILFREMG